MCDCKHLTIFQGPLAAMLVLCDGGAHRPPFEADQQYDQLMSTSPAGFAVPGTWLVCLKLGAHVLEGYRSFRLASRKNSRNSTMGGGGTAKPRGEELVPLRVATIVGNFGTGYSLFGRRCLDQSQNQNKQQKGGKRRPKGSQHFFASPKSAEMVPWAGNLAGMLMLVLCIITTVQLVALVLAQGSAVGSSNFSCVRGTLPPMEPDKGVLENNFAFKGTPERQVPCSLVGGYVCGTTGIPQLLVAAF